MKKSIYAAVAIEQTTLAFDWKLIGFIQEVELIETSLIAYLWCVKANQINDAFQDKRFGRFLHSYYTK